MLIFIVDDSPIFRQALRVYLSERLPELEVEEFSTAEACLHEMDRDPDVVIMDYFLNSDFPDAWNGIEGLKKIKQIAPMTYIILLSAQKEIDPVLEGMREGAFDYVVKDELAFQRIEKNILSISESAIDEEDERLL